MLLAQRLFIPHIWAEATQTPPRKLPQPDDSLELIDTHCHLDLDPLAGSVEAVLARARASGVRTCLSIGTTVEASRANVELARRFPMVRAAVGVHPHEADGVTDETLQQIDTLAEDPTVVAIGEVGLDAYRQRALPESQQRVLEGFVALAARRGLPLLLHCREAYEPLLALLRHSGRTPVRGVIHCASGPPEFIRGALDLGLHISFAGNVTFPSAHALRALVPLVPDDRLLIETDAPFLAPQPVRGQPNEPAHVAHTAACLAQLRGTTPAALGELTSRNARRLFNLPML
jgi:TatD DNase family protein